MSPFFSKETVILGLFFIQYYKMIPKFDRTALLILDGWGHGKNPEVSAIAQASTPFVDSLYQDYPQSELVTFGELVGLPAGQMGNSEVGHLNIGAGRIVYQELLRINNAIEDRSFFENDALVEALNYAKIHQKPIHLLGLLSDGGVHSHLNHLKALCDATQDKGLEEVYIHAFMDGRDTDPKGGVGYLEDLLNHLQGSTVQLASICGRYYAMDRDNRWERIKLAYDLMVHQKGTYCAHPVEALQKSYQAGISDEFVRPIRCADTAIKAGDVVLCFNFRTDRCRQIVRALCQEDLVQEDMHQLPLKMFTMTSYDDSFKDISVLFDKKNLKNTLGEVLSKASKTQVRIAETEKYPHVTFFFSGGREAAFFGETRAIIPSPKVATYDLQPEMSAYKITANICEQLASNSPDFICLNFANTDMVGHTGVFEAAIKAAETVDECMKKLCAELLKNDYGILVIADHGNSDFMINEDGSPHTAHTTNLVPCFLLGKETKGLQLNDGKLADVAPTILAMMQLEAPEEMKGNCLINRTA